MVRTSQIVEKLSLKTHPDGGFYVETFRDHSVILSKSHLPPQYKVDRAVSTAIYFLLPSGSVARLHRIPCAETFHHYLGEPITVMELNESDGQIKLTTVGPNLLEDEQPQYTIPPFVWFGSFPTKDVTIFPGCSKIEVAPRDPENHYSLLGVTCAPAFQYEDSGLAKRSELVARFPKTALRGCWLVWVNVKMDSTILRVDRVLRHGRLIKWARLTCGTRDWDTLT